MKTYQPREKDIERKWHLIDAEDQVLGRLSTQISSLLIGKHKPVFAKHVDVGDFVVVLNVEKVFLTGKKESQKLYRSHSGYPGGFKEISVEKLREKHPQRIIKKAVFGMLPDNRLKKQRMIRLKLVVGNKNPFAHKFGKEKENGKKD